MTWKIHKAEECKHGISLWLHSWCNECNKEKKLEQMKEGWD